MLTAEPGTPVTYNYEYARNDVSNLLMCSLRSWKAWRRVGGDEAAHESRLWAQQVQRLVGDLDYPDKRIVLVMDNLHTHAPASLYEAFELAEARRISRTSGNPLHDQARPLDTSIYCYFDESFPI